MKNARLHVALVACCLWGLLGSAKGGHLADWRSLRPSLDSVVADSSVRPFNGVAVVAQHGRIVYTGRGGHADPLRQLPWERHARFVIGSVTKQFTAVLALRACAAGRLDLHAPLRTYLPALPQAWADTVTAHQLLCHTSGFQGRAQPLAFPAGSRFAYSNAGYGLLAELLEVVEGQSFAALLTDLCRRAGLRHAGLDGDIVGRFARGADGAVATDDASWEGLVPAAALLRATPADLVRWNTALWEGDRLLPAGLRDRMTAAASVRPHPIFGNVDYGYGIQMTAENGLQEYSHGGYVPGHIAVNFYYPATGVSLVVMENLDWLDPSYKSTYWHEMELRKRVRKFLE